MTPKAAKQAETDFIRKLQNTIAELRKAGWTREKELRELLREACDLYIDMNSVPPEWASRARDLMKESEQLQPTLAELQNAGLMPKIPSPEARQAAEATWRKVTELADTLEESIADLNGDTRFIRIIAEGYDVAAAKLRETGWSIKISPGKPASTTNQRTK
jgi:hypothetical protein